MLSSSPCIVESLLTSDSTPTGQPQNCMHLTSMSADQLWHIEVHSIHRCQWHVWRHDSYPQQIQEWPGQNQTTWDGTLHPPECLRACISGISQVGLPCHAGTPTLLLSLQQSSSLCSNPKPPCLAADLHAITQHSKQVHFTIFTIKYNATAPAAIASESIDISHSVTCDMKFRSIFWLKSSLQMCWQRVEWCKLGCTTYLNTWKRRKFATTAHIAAAAAKDLIVHPTELE